MNLRVRRRIRAFVEARILPLERDPEAYDDHENIREERLQALRAEARAEGLWAVSMDSSDGRVAAPRSSRGR